MVGEFIPDMKQIQRRINDLGRKGATVENQSLKAGGNILADRMRENVNRSDKNQEHIEDHIKVSRVITDMYGLKYVKVGPDKEVAWRAKFLEFGTEKMSADPFIETSADESQDEMSKAISEVLKEGLGL